MSRRVSAAAVRHHEAPPRSPRPGARVSSTTLSSITRAPEPEIEAARLAPRPAKVTLADRDLSAALYLVDPDLGGDGLQHGAVDPLDRELEAAPEREGLDQRAAGPVDLDHVARLGRGIGDGLAPPCRSCRPVLRLVTCCATAIEPNSAITLPPGRPKAQPTAWRPDPQRRPDRAPRGCAAAPGALPSGIDRSAWSLCAPHRLVVARLRRP